MADKPLFNLDAKGRWRLAYDRQQWVVQRRAQKARVRRLEGHAIADSGWRGVAFIGSEKRGLRRVPGEKGIALTAEAAAQLDPRVPPHPFRRAFILDPTFRPSPIFFASLLRNSAYFGATRG